MTSYLSSRLERGHRWYLHRWSARRYFRRQAQAATAAWQGRTPEVTHGVEQNRGTHSFLCCCRSTRSARAETPLREPTRQSTAVFAQPAPMARGAPPYQSLAAFLLLGGAYVKSAGSMSTARCILGEPVNRQRTSGITEVDFMGPSTNPRGPRCSAPEPNLCRELSETAICCDHLRARTWKDRGR